MNVVRARREARPRAVTASGAEFAIKKAVRRFFAVLALLTACIAGVAEPTPAPPEETEEDEREPSPSTPSETVPEEEPATDRCVRTSRLEEIELPDGGRTTVELYEECLEVPERDLGDPPPGS